MVAKRLVGMVMTAGDAPMHSLHQICLHLDAVAEAKSAKVENE